LKGTKYDITIEADKRINPYVKWYIDIRILVHDNEKKDVMENGKKIIKDYGRIKLIFNGRLELDPDKRWETANFKKLEKFFHKHIVKWEADMIWFDDLYYVIYQMREDFARYMNMYFIG